MMKLKKLKLFDEKRYKEMVSEVGKNRYSIFYEGEATPGSIFKMIQNLSDYNCVIAGTASTTSSYQIDMNGMPDVTIPKSSPIMVVRLLRYDNSHGIPHYNADDQFIFPSTDGHVWRVTRNDAPDHFIGLAATSNLIKIADAYNLPSEKSGFITQYKQNGASLHIEIKAK
jgi:hypothetical protein